MPAARMEYQVTTTTPPRTGAIETPRDTRQVRIRPRPSGRRSLAFWTDWAPIILMGAGGLAAGIISIFGTL